jgi:hypothetical protein
MIYKGMFALQNCMDSEKGEQSPYGEPYPTDGDEDHDIIIKAEEFLDVEVEEDPMPIIFPEIKAEPEASSISLFVQN